MSSCKRLDKFVPWAMLLFVCTACASLSGDPLSKYNDQQLEQIGERLLAARDFGQGLKFLTVAEKRRPNDPKIQYLLGLGFAERGLENEALAHYQKALLLKPDYSEVYNALGGLYVRQGLTDKAEDAFKKALTNPFYQNPHLALYNLGALYENKGDMEAALNQYREAIRLDPTYGVVYYRMGLILENLKRGDQAREAYALAVKYAPELAEAHLRYGVMCYLAGEIETALYSLNRVLRLAPESSLAVEARRYLSRMGGVMNSGGESPASGVLAPEKLSRIDVMTEQDLMRSGFGTPTKQSPVPPPGTTSSGAALQGSEAEASTSRDVPEQQENVTAAAQPVPEIRPRKVISQGLEAEAPKIHEAHEQEPSARATPQPAPTETAPPKTEAREPEVEGPRGNEIPEQETKETPAQPATEAVAALSPGVARETPPPEPQWQYIIQVGSYVDKQNAESEQQKLKRRGYSAIVKPIKHQVLGQVYVVQLKPVNSAAKASTLMTQLESGEQVKPVLIRVPAN